MATLTISVPDDVLREAKARVGRRGHATVEEYLVSFVHSLTMEGEPVAAKTEAALLEGLESPLFEEMAAADWDAKLRRYDERRGSEHGKGGAR